MKVNCLAIVASYFDLRIRLGSTTHMVKSEPKATAPRTASISFFSCLDVLSLSVSPSSASLNLRPILTWLCFAIIAVLLTPCNILPGPFPLARRPGPPCTGSFFFDPSVIGKARYPYKEIARVILRSAVMKNPAYLQISALHTDIQSQPPSDGLWKLACEKTVESQVRRGAQNDGRVRPLS